MAVVSVLVLISVGAGLLAAAGEALFMGSPVYLVVPVLKAVLLLVLCAWMARGRRWAVVTMLVVQTLALVGFGFGLLLGLTPWFTASVTLSGLLTGVGVPIAVLWVCVGLLRLPSRSPSLSARGPGVTMPWPVPAAAALPAGVAASLPSAWPVGAGPPSVPVPAGAPPPSAWPATPSAPVPAGALPPSAWPVGAGPTSAWPVGVVSSAPVLGAALPPWAWTSVAGPPPAPVPAGAPLPSAWPAATPAAGLGATRALPTERLR